MTKTWFAWLPGGDFIYCDDEDEARGLVEAHVEDHSFGAPDPAGACWGQATGRVECVRSAVVCPECGQEDDEHEDRCHRPDLEFEVEFAIVELTVET